MFKRYFQVIILLLFPVVAGAQSLSVSAQGDTPGGSTSTLSLAGGAVSFDKSQVEFLNSGATVNKFLEYGISPDLSVVGFLFGSNGDSNALLMDANGDTLSNFKVTTLDSSDPSIGAYPASTGALLVRDNIASFSFYDSFGNIITQVSSSTQSTEGEAISEVAMDPHAQTVVIYNPQVKRNGSIGSQAQVLNASNELQNIYSNPAKRIENVTVSEDGQFIVLLTGNGGAADEVIIMDRYGNELNSISSDENLIGARLSDDAEYITLFSNGRVLVYNTLSGERKGSTSIREPVVVAEYFPEDDTILCMTGDHSPSTNVVRNLNFHAIHVGKRQIARQGYSSPVGLNDEVRLGLVRTGRGQYQLQGASQQLQIQAAF